MAIAKNINLNKLDRKFLNDSMKEPMLSRDEEKKLAEAWVFKNDKKAMHKIIRAYSKLVIAFSMKFKNYGLPVNDLVQEGHIGLMQAMAKFEPDRDIRFSTYASWWIRSAIQDYVLKNWSIVRTGTTASQKALFFSLRRLKLELSKYSKNEEEVRSKVAKKLNIKVADVENMENRFIHEDKSLNAKVSDDYNQEFGNFIVDENSLNELDIVNRLDLARKRSWFKKAMRELGIRESQIIALRHLSDDPLTLEKLGELFKISKERVRQIENRAIKKLKSLVRKLSSKESRLLKIK
ncbi:MAG: RNA polymerase factor sigma-32 [Alphaproteobacteria bacterium]|nr:MAG: RNA polymerase factor sigma-32 [Alphaproteobacteria bacterium]